MRSTLTRLAATPKATSYLAATVLLALVATTLGYFQLSNAVTLTLDGKKTEVRTFGDTVGEVLESEGVKVSDRDVVVPSASSPVSDTAEISVRFARPLKLNVDGTTSTEWTTARTVSSALTDLNLRHEGAKLSASRSASIGRDGMAITMATPKDLIVKIGAKKPVKKSVPAITAEEALKQLGVKFDEDDQIKPGKRVLKDGDTLVLTKVRVETETVKAEKVPFTTTKRNDDSIYEGETKVERAGVPGSRDVTYKVIWHNGKIHKKVVLEQKKLSDAKAKIVRVGTKEKPAANFAGGSGPFDRIAQCESGGNWSINTGNGYYGGLQFNAQTWRAYGGTGLPHQHSRETQIAVAQRLVAAQGGYGAWPHCGKLA